MSIDESFENYAPVAARARDEGMHVRGYVSTAFGCPYEGDVPPEKVLEVCGAPARSRLLRGLDRRHDRRRHADAGAGRDRHAAAGHPGLEAGDALSRHARHRAGEHARGAGDGHRHVRRLRRRPRRLSVRAGRLGQSRDRGPRLHARPDGHRDRRRSRTASCRRRRSSRRISIIRCRAATCRPARKAADAVRRRALPVQ